MAKPAYAHPASTREGRIERAVYVLGLDDGHPVAWKVAFFQSKGLDGTEIAEALNTATGGAVVAAALGD